MAADIVISVSDLHKTYQLGELEVRALRGVSLTVERGEFVAIMGASGSGKSTLMNIIGCLDRPSAGRYLLEGVDVASLSEPDLARIRSSRIGFVFQSFNLLSRTSALENVELPLFYSGDPAAGVTRAYEVLALMGLAGRERSHPNQLSGGQQQRVAIARALINNPAILMADEPTGNLDSRTSLEIMATLQKLNRGQGLTIALVTHDAELAAFAARVVTLRDGLIVSDNPQTARQAAAGAGDSPAPMPAPVGNQALADKVPESDAAPLTFALMALRAAARALARNKLRSILTMLGIFIGVAALIAMVAVGQGANEAVEEQIASLGTNLLIVMPGATTANGVRAGFGSVSTLTVGDAEAIVKDDWPVARVSYLDRQLAQVEYNRQNWSTNVQGVTPSYMPIRNWAVVEGRSFTEEDERSAARVCLLGQTVVTNLFGNHTDPVGAQVRVKDVDMQVVGVLEAKGQSGWGQDQDDVVLIPFSTAERKVIGVAAPPATSPSSAATPSVENPYAAMPTASSIYSSDSTETSPFGSAPKLTGVVHTIFVQVKTQALIPQAIDQIVQTLHNRHHIQPGQNNDFDVRNLSAVAQAAEGSSRIMALLLATVASISLLVGGIGIMNILLVSVTERTREIGIRMAIGARRVHILLQFLVEAILLSMIGGVGGILAGIGASQAISSLAGWPTLLSPAAMVGGFLFSAAVGIFFGYYPARKASLLNPIDALRYE
ncbi:MAG TPA: ABC transporter permease [Candidatus Binataceae bacterium]|nr:ABC transporter permease [Candidatus Binataceae bacterium]